MAWSVLQSASNPMSFGTAIETTTVTLGTNCSSGTVLLAYIYIAISGSTSVITSVKDNNGNSFTQIADVINSTVGHQVEVAVYALATPAGDVGTKPTITCTPNALATYAGGMLVQEVSGIQAVADGTFGKSTGNASPTGTPAYSSSTANEYLISVIGEHDANGQTLTGPSSPWTTDAHAILTNTSGGGGGPLGVSYRNSTGGSESDGWTDSLGTGADQFGLIVGAFNLSLSTQSIYQPANPGRSWKRRFKPVRTTLPYYNNQLSSGPSYATNYDIIGNSAGQWVNPANAEGAPDGNYATWTTP